MVFLRTLLVLALLPALGSDLNFRNGTSLAPLRKLRSDPKAAPLRVYVYTEQAAIGAVSEDEQGRLDSVRDVKEALHRNAKIAVVETADAAQVLVEVVGREKHDAPAGGFGGAVITPLVETTIRLRVTFGERETEIRGIGQAYWSRAAKDAAERLTKWIARVAPKP